MIYAVDSTLSNQAIEFFEHIHVIFRSMIPYRISKVRFHELFDVVGCVRQRGPPSRQRSLQYVLSFVRVIWLVFIYSRKVAQGHQGRFANCWQEMLVVLRWHGFSAHTTKPFPLERRYWLAQRQSQSRRLWQTPMMYL